MQFEFRTAGHILFGSGVLELVGSAAAELGQRALVVMGRSADRVQPLLRRLDRHRLAYSGFHVSQEPTLDTLRKGLACARDLKADLVIGFGGGSVVDTGKAISALATNHEDVRTYLEVIGQAKPLEKRPLPYVAIPTTAGTGAEVTRNAVIKSTREHVKVSLRSPWMLPSLAVVDPELTLSLPPAVTAGTGMDALAQLLEGFVSSRANPMTDALCREGLRRSVRSLQKAFHHPDDLDARVDMCLASLLSGMVLANAGLGAVHGIAGPLGGLCAAPHGAACARLLPPVFKANAKALADRHPESAQLSRFQEIARLLTGADTASTSDGVAWLERRCEEFQIPYFRDCGFTGSQIPQLVDQASRASSMQANPVELTAMELEDIIIEAFGPS